MRHLLLVYLVLTLPAACSFGDQFRGTDRSAFLPSMRAKWAWRNQPAPTRAERLAYVPMLEAGATNVAGDFAQPPTRPDYRATTLHVAFAPEFTLRNVRVGPIAGLAYGDVEVDSGSGHAGQSGLGLALGFEASYRAWSFLAPYARYQENSGLEWSTGRFEVGVDLRASAAVGVMVAYARQTNRIDDIELFGVGDGARIESEGLHVGLSLRF